MVLFRMDIVKIGNVREQSRDKLGLPVSTVSSRFWYAPLVHPTCLFSKTTIYQLLPFAKATNEFKPFPFSFTPDLTAVCTEFDITISIVVVWA